MTPTTTKTPPRLSRAALAALASERNIARQGAERHLEGLLAQARNAEREQRAFEAGRVPPEDIHPAHEYDGGMPGGFSRSGGTVRYHEAPTVEALAAAEARVAEAQEAYDDAHRQQQEAPADTPGPEACRSSGNRFYCGQSFTLGERTYYCGEVVPNRELEALDGRRVAAMLKARYLRDGAPFAGLVSS